MSIMLSLIVKHTPNAPAVNPIYEGGGGGGASEGWVAPPVPAA